MTPDLFFPLGEREEQAAAQLALARSVCAGCPVRLHCLVFSVVTNQEDGVWGGLAPSERRILQRTRRLRRKDRFARLVVGQGRGTSLNEHSRERDAP